MKKLPLVLLVLLSACPNRSRQISDEDKERCQGHLDLCAAAMGQQDFRSALGECQQAEALNPDDADVQYALGMTYWLGFGRFAESKEHLGRAITLREKFSEAENSMGSVLMAEGRYEDAIPWFEKAKSNLLWATPHYAEQNLGWALYKTGKTDQGISHLKSAINMKPEACGAYDHLASIYTDQGKDAEARTWLLKYLQVCDSDRIRKFLPPGQLSANLYRLGMASLRTGDRDGARGYLQACSERFPTDPAAENCKKNLQLLE